MYNIEINFSQELESVSQCVHFKNVFGRQKVEFERKTCRNQTKCRRTKKCGGHLLDVKSRKKEGKTE